MKLLSLEFKNIGSYGKEIQTINFDSSSSDLILIQGKNGNGKCLDPSTEIEIEFFDEKIRESVVSFINNKRNQIQNE